MDTSKTQLALAPPPQGGCQATTRAGTPCRAFSVGDTGYCLAHDPARQGQAQAARRKGAQRAGTLRTIRRKRARLDTPAALVRFTATLIQDTLEGVVEPDVARVCLYGLSIQRALLVTSDLEQRIEALEARTPPMTKGERPWAG